MNHIMQARIYTRCVYFTKFFRYWKRLTDINQWRFRYMGYTSEVEAITASFNLIIIYTICINFLHVLKISVGVVFLIWKEEFNQTILLNLVASSSNKIFIQQYQSMSIVALFSCAFQLRSDYPPLLLVKSERACKMQRILSLLPLV